MIFLYFIQPVHLLITNYFGRNTSCFNNFFSAAFRVSSISSQLTDPSAANQVLTSYTHGGLNQAGSTPLCSIVQLSVETSNINRQHFQLTQICTTSNIRIQGSVFSGSSVTDLKISYAWSTEPAVRFGTHVTSSPVTDHQSWVLVSYGFTVDLSKSPLVTYFINGYHLQKTSDKLLGLHLKWDNQQLTTSDMQIRMLTDQNNSLNINVNKLLISFVVAERGLIPLGTKAVLGYYFGDQVLDRVSSHFTDIFYNIPNLPPQYLASNLVYGINAIFNDMTASMRTSYGIKFDSMAANIQKFVMSPMQPTSLYAHGAVFFSFYGIDCKTQNLFYNPNSNDCQAACPAGLVPNLCNYCVTCHYTCGSCSSASSSDCFHCSSSVSFRTWTLVSGTTGTCTCSGAFFQGTPSAFICKSCHYSCASCDSSQLSFKCLTCSTNRSPSSGTSPFSCPCQNGFVQISQICQTCAVGCLTCSGSVINCLSCSSGLWLSISNSCSSVCPPGQFKSSTPGQCASCQGSAPFFCQTCQNTQSNCLSCVSPKLLYLNQCLNDCPSGYYPDNRICLNCVSPCAECSSASSCSRCSKPWALHEQACVGQCPSTFQLRETTRGNFCFDCAVSCIRINQISLRVADSENEAGSSLIATIRVSSRITDIRRFMQLDLQFKADVSYVVSEDGLTITALIIPRQSFVRKRVVLRSAKKESDIEGVSGLPLRDDSWGRTVQFNYLYIKGNSTLISKFSNRIYNISRKLAPQLLALLPLALPSLQLTSCLFFVNTTLPLHLYDGLRIISIGNLFQIPSWSGLPEDRLIVGRFNMSRLASSRLLNEVPYQLWRTSLGSYFLFNTYIQLLFLLFFLLFNALLQALHSNKVISSYWASLGWSLCDYIHQYFSMNLIVSFSITVQSLNAQGLIGWSSLSVCIIVLIEYICYHLYRLVDFISLQDSDLDTEEYKLLMVRFRHMLTNVSLRKVEAAFWLRPWICPVFYRLISPLKKMIMMLAFALFSQQFYYQLGIICLIQIVETCRLAIIRPYASLWRNFFRGVIQVLVTGLFIGLAYLGWVSSSLSEENVNEFQVLGWVLLSICYLFNLYFLVMLVESVILRLLSRQEGRIREQYRRSAFQYIRQQGQKLTVDQFTTTVARANLTNSDLRVLPDIEVKVEDIYVSRGTVKYWRCKQLRMSTKASHFSTTNNTLVTKKVNHILNLEQLSNQILKFLQLNFKDAQQYSIKTFCLVRQRLYTYGALIPQEISCQEIQRDGRRQILRGENLYKELPLAIETI